MHVCVFGRIKKLQQERMKLYSLLATNIISWMSEEIIIFLANNVC